MCAQDKAGLASHRQARSQKTFWPSGNAAIRFPCPLSSHGCRVFSQYSSTSMSPPPPLWRRSGGPAGGADVASECVLPVLALEYWTRGPGPRPGRNPTLCRTALRGLPAGRTAVPHCPRPRSPRPRRSPKSPFPFPRGATPPPRADDGQVRDSGGKDPSPAATAPPPPPPPTRLCEATRRNVPRGPATVSTPAPASASSSTECVRVSFIHRRSGSCSPRRGHSSPGEGEGGVPEWRRGLDYSAARPE